MHYTIKAIPTTYKGVNFRSRLEARWAVMFDKLGWHWRYEPVDLDGWIPDFIVNDVLPVEVKPYLWANSDDPTKMVDPEVVAKMKGHLGLVLGADARCGTRSPFVNDFYPIGVFVGSWWQNEDHAEAYDNWCDALDIAALGESGCEYRFDVFETNNSYRSRFNYHEFAPRALGDVPQRRIDSWWVRAGNIVQYKHKSRV